MVVKERLRYPIAEASELLGKSAKALRHDAHAGKIAVVRDGTRMYIHSEELKRYAATPQPSRTRTESMEVAR